MNLRQMRYVTEIAKRNLNISSAALALHTNQPGISKQVKLLEAELGFEIFLRSRNRLCGVTPHGETIIALAQNILNSVANMKALGEEVAHDARGSIVVGITHTQARYVLPAILKVFSKTHPKVTITLHHADAAHIVQMLTAGDADIGITASSDLPKARNLIVLPFREFQRVVLVPRGHKLLSVRKPTLKNLAQYPIVTYEAGYAAREDLVRAFGKEGIEPKIAISAIDADVIKTCVEQGLGITVLSEVTFDPKRDVNLRCIPAKHLFEPSSTKLVLSRDHYLRHYVYDFIELCAPSWGRGNVQRAVQRGIADENGVEATLRSSR
jgi:LysR family cys regulon transcriptional activator